MQDTKILALRQLALSEISACGRNWYLTEALCTDGFEIKPSEDMKKRRIHSGSLYDLFLLLTVLLDFEVTQDVVESACFHFTDVDEHFIFKVILIQLCDISYLPRLNFCSDASHLECYRVLMNCFYMSL